MHLFAAMRTSGSALTAERLRMDVVTENLANLNTTRTAQGGAYRRKVAVLQEQTPAFNAALAGAGGVAVATIAPDPAPLPRKYDPGHPDAGPDGWVEMPNVEVAQEIVELLMASRAYDANVTAFNAAKAIALKALEIGR